MNMKTFTVFPDESADMSDAPRRTVKSSLKMAGADIASSHSLVSAGSGDDSDEPDLKRLEAAVDKREPNLRPDIRQAGTARLSNP